MKKINISYLLTALIVVLSLSSCLRDKNIDDQKYGIRIQDLEVNKIVEIPIISHQASLTVLPEGDKVEAEVFPIRLAAKNPAQEDIVVHLKASHKGLNPDEDNLFPLNDVILPATVTIPKGERQVMVKAQLKSSAISADGGSLVVEIGSVDQPGYLISGNFGHITLNVKLKSKYAGTYEYTILETTAWKVETNAPKKVTLETNSPTVVAMPFLGGIFGPGTLVFYEFDPKTNTVVAMELPAFNVLKVESSTWDAATKTLMVKFNLGGAGKPDRYVVEKFVRID